MCQVTNPDNFLYSRQRLKSVSRPGWPVEAGKGGGKQTIRASTVVTYVKGGALMILSFKIIRFGFMGCVFHNFLNFRGGLKIHLLEGW